MVTEITATTPLRTFRTREEHEMLKEFMKVQKDLFAKSVAEVLKKKEPGSK